LREGKGKERRGIGQKRNKRRVKETIYFLYCLVKYRRKRKEMLNTVFGEREERKRKERFYLLIKNTDGLIHTPIT
jgi:hypothetical protein